MSKEQYLKNLGISALNNMQQETVAAYRENQDIILLSPTGSGKTLAFSLLVQQRLNPIKNQIQCLILVPTRELALQIEQVVRKMPDTAKVTCIYGGNETRAERNKLLEAPQVLIGTPGRVIYHLERQHIDLSTVDTLVLDEFDKSLELGFHDQMAQILSFTKSPFHILTSATPLDEFPDFIHLQQPVTLNFLENQDYRPDLTFKKVVTAPKNKMDALLKLICKIGDQKMLIFFNHREAVNHISDLLRQRDQEIQHSIFHGGLDQFDRELALLTFRNNTSRILLATDLAARGLDIPEVDAIIHYQLPPKEDAFVHRNGRTARMKAKGTVYLVLKDGDHFDYLPNAIEEEDISGNYPVPDNNPTATLLINAGKKNKVNKIDIVGYLLNIPGISKEDIGIIEIKDKHAFVAMDTTVYYNEIVRKDRSIGKIKGNKIKISRIN